MFQKIARDNDSVQSDQKIRQFQRYFTYNLPRNKILKLLTWTPNQTEHSKLFKKSVAKIVWEIQYSKLKIPWSINSQIRYLGAVKLAKPGILTTSSLARDEFGF